MFIAEIINVWLSDDKETGIVERTNNSVKFSTSFEPFQIIEYKSNHFENIDSQNFSNYRGARKFLNSYTTERLKKINVEDFEKTYNYTIN